MNNRNILKLIVICLGLLISIRFVYILCCTTPIGDMTFRNSCIIEDAVLCKGYDNEYREQRWYIKLADRWHHIDDYDSGYLDTALVKTNLTDSINTYKFKPEFYCNRFGHRFESVDVTIHSTAPSWYDDIDLQSGIYRHRFCIWEEYRWLKPEFHPYANVSMLTELSWYLRGVFVDLHLRAWNSLEQLFTKSSTSLLGLYNTRWRITIHEPLLYLPFPLSDKGYLFDARRLIDFDFISILIAHDQNFYATLANIPPDIRRLGKVVALDKNGVLLSLEKEKTPNMKVYMQRIQDDELYYASFVNSRKTHKKELINDDEYQMILEHSDKVDKSYALYDKEIFVNLRKMLSFLDYEELSEKHGC